MLDILFIDDNPDESDIISRAINQLDRPANYLIISNGTDGVNYLLQQGNFQGVRLPRIVFIDLVMPDLSGFEVIKRIRSNSRTRYVPLIVCSMSDDANDIRTVYDLGANAYLIKPGSYHQKGIMMQKAIDFWLMDQSFAH